jgi:hypothetical protein
MDLYAHERYDFIERSIIPRRTGVLLLTQSYDLKLLGTVENEDEQEIQLSPNDCLN